MMRRMRYTVRIDDDLLKELRKQAHEEKIPLTVVLNRVLRTGIEASRNRDHGRAPHREEVHPMGKPRSDLHRAMALTMALEDEETVRKLTLRK
jgi:hypothetical protein